MFRCGSIIISKFAIIEYCYKINKRTMNFLIEQEIFKKGKINFNVLEDYGFLRFKDVFKYEKLFLNDEFCAQIEINSDGNVTGKVIDTDCAEEYLPLRVKDKQSPFAKEVEFNYRNILLDIKEKCFISKPFVFEQSNRICDLILEKYNISPDFPWEGYNHGVFRNPDNNKWFALIMNIDRNKIDKSKKGEIEVINVKLDKEKIQELLKDKNYYPAYHMNKKSWITMVLDEKLSDNEIMQNISQSYSFTVC